MSLQSNVHHDNDLQLVNGDRRGTWKDVDAQCRHTESSVTEIRTCQVNSHDAEHHHELHTGA